MKKVLTALAAVLICFSLCACSLSVSKIQSNLKDAGYSIIEIEEKQLEDLNNELKYSYKGSGSIVNGFYAVNPVTYESITVLEFANKSDLTLMYKIAKETIEDGEAVDLSGYILIYGNENGVKAALN